LTFGELEADSNRAAQLFRSLGLKAGDAVAAYLPNIPAYFSVAWAAQRSGLYFVALSSRLTLEEVEYIARDSGAKVVVADAKLENTASLASKLSDLSLFTIGGAVEGFRSWEEATLAM